MKLQPTNSDSNSNSTSKSKTDMTKHEQLDCPRCGSNDTKFCYYNNYNTCQPRHFCRNCRRFWTKGGALRNVPIGGGTRRKSSKRLSKKHLAESAVTAPAVKDTAGHSQPVLKMPYQPVIAPNLSGYFGKFNLSVPGLPLSVPVIQSWAEGSAGQNEMFFLNGGLNHFYGGWQ